MFFDQDNLNCKWNGTIHYFRPLQRTFTQVTHERCISMRKNLYSFVPNLTFRGPYIVIYSYNESQQDALILNFILAKNSTCFGQIYCPSSRVLILYSHQLVFVILVMLTVC